MGKRFRLQFLMKGLQALTSVFKSRSRSMVKYCRAKKSSEVRGVDHELVSTQSTKQRVQRGEESQQHGGCTHRQYVRGKRKTSEDFHADACDRRRSMQFIRVFLFFLLPN